MPHLPLSGIAAVTAVAFGVPVLLGLFPRLRLPSVVLEILAGIAIGPSGFGWVGIDPAIQILSVIGLAFLLVLAGREMVDHLRGGLLRAAVVNFAISIGLALGVASMLRGVGLVQSPLLIAIILASTSTGVILPVLKDAGREASELGRLVIASAAIADFGTIALLSMLFSREASNASAKLTLWGIFVLLAAAIALLIARAGRSMRLSAIMSRLQDTTAQIRVRGVFMVLAAFIALAQWLGLEVVFAAFTVGVILKLVDPDETSAHSNVRPKLEAVGFGVFIPMFFVASGLQFNLRALVSSPTTIALVPVFFTALFVIHGLPAVLYRSALGPLNALAAGMLQATSLGFIVVAAQVGMELGMLSQATGAALVASGLLSVIIFPATALTLLGRPASEAAVAVSPAMPGATGLAGQRPLPM
jgi:Kef-type K+ transport system membrane component KefB